MSFVIILALKKYNPFSYIPNRWLGNPKEAAPPTYRRREGQCKLTAFHEAYKEQGATGYFLQAIVFTGAPGSV